MERVFGVDVLIWPFCRGPLLVVAVIEEPTVVGAMLAATSISSALRDRPRARAPRARDRGDDGLDRGQFALLWPDDS